MDFIRSRLVERHTTATETIEEDLPINPLSHAIISIDGYNVTDETTLAEFLAFINTVQVVHNGTSVLTMQSEDLYALNAYLFRNLPTLTGRLATDNYARSLGLIVPMGRRLMDPEECYPATKRGEFQIKVNTTVPATSIDNSTISIDTVELPGATPQRFLKSFMRTITAPGATGDNDILLAMGNKIICAQLRMTTIPTTSSHTYGVQQASILVDNKEYKFASAEIACLIAERALRVGCPDTTIAAQGLSPLNNIAWLDFDVNGDGQFVLETADKSEVKLRLNMGVDEATYVTIMELEDV